VKRKRTLQGDEEDGLGDFASKRLKVNTSKIKTKQTAPQSRYILFVGNLRYTSTKECVANHFSLCDPPPTVRLVTPKGSTKSKGCAFVEFTHPNALQQGLKLHHTVLEGRTINVELTVGGGGKSSDRLRKLRERNQSLNKQRNKHQARRQGDSGADGLGARLSLTSGVDERPNRERTWTVGKRTENEKTRGGKKHKSSKNANTSKLKSKPYKPTGANAIAVG